MAQTNFSLLVFSKSNSLRESLALFLSTLGQVTIAGAVSTDQEALAAIARQAPNLILIDALEQHQEAFRLLEIIKARWPAIRCCFLAESPARAELARSSGADSVLVWGVPSERLAAEIRRLMAGQDGLPPAPAQRPPTGIV